MHRHPPALWVWCGGGGLGCYDILTKTAAAGGAQNTAPSQSIALVANTNLFHPAPALSSALRPVIVDPLEARDEEEGNPESSMHKNEQYKQERKEGPR